MRKSIFGVLSILSFSLLLISGCAKDQVKPDEGMAPKSVPDAKAPATPPKDVPQKIEEKQLAQGTSQSEETRLSADEQQKMEAAQRMLKTINFEFDSYILNQKARDILTSNAEYLLKKYKGKVKLEGHCDERGSDEYNLALGENRAKAALNYLLSLGVPADQLSIISYGKERPLDKESSEEAWAKNRRVEFAVFK